MTKTPRIITEKLIVLLLASGAGKQITNNNWPAAIICLTLAIILQFYRLTFQQILEDKPEHI